MKHIKLFEEIDFDDEDWEWEEEEPIIEDEVMRVGDWVVAKFNNRYSITRDLWVGKIDGIGYYSEFHVSDLLYHWTVEKKYFIKGYKYDNINDINNGDSMIYNKTLYRVNSLNGDVVSLINNNGYKININRDNLKMVTRIYEKDIKNLNYKE